MTGRDDFDRTLARWFEADALAPAPAGGLDRALDATRRRRPRPSLVAGPGSHWVGEAPGAGLARGGWSLRLVILLLIVAALLGGAILVGARVFQAPQLPTGQLGHLAYGLDGDFYVADWDGTNPIRIADGAPADRGPACQDFRGDGSLWSPDGRHLAYRSGCHGTVILSDPAGKAVAEFPGDGWLVSWSPDSTRVSTWIELDRTIGIYGVDGERQALLTVPPGCALPGDFDPVWSPDGISLVIAGCMVPIAGRAPERLPATDPRSHFNSAYSRDGSRIAFIASPDSTSLVIANTVGIEIRTLSGARTVSNGEAPGGAYEHPVLSTTGDRVSFVWSPALYDQASDPPLTHELRVVDVASGMVTTLARASGTFPLVPLAFSPEGDRILFSRTGPNNVTSLWTVNADGSDARLLVPGSESGDWQWQPRDS